MVLEGLLLRNYILVFQCLIGFLYAPACLAAPLSLAHYLSVLLEQNEELKSAELNVKIANENLRITEDLYQTSVTVTPSQTTSNYQFSKDTKTTDVNFELSQLLPTGTNVSLKGTRILDNSLEQRSYQGSTDSIVITQPLYKNSFGELFRKDISAAEFALAASKKQRDLQKINTCLQGIESFASTYRFQEQVKIYTEIEKTSGNLLALANRLRKKRLIRKLDLLSARADYLRIHSLLLEAQKDHQQSISTLSQYLNSNETNKENETLFLANPTMGFRKFPHLITFNVSTNASYLESINILRSKELAVKAAQSTARSDVDLFLETGNTKGRVEINSGYPKFEDSFVTVGLKWTLPLNNQTLKANIAKADFERQIAQNNISLKERNLKSEFEQLIIQIKNLNQQLTISKSKSDKYRDQVKEADRLLNAGKLEFEEYYRYRDALLNENIDALKLKQSYWQQKSLLAAIDHKTGLLCWEQM